MAKSTITEVLEYLHSHIKRINDSKKRPIVLKSTIQEIKKIIKQRSKIYSMSQFKINCHKLSKAEIVKKIIKIYELI